MFGMPSYIICLFDGVYFDAWILELSLGKHLLIAIKIKVDTLLVIFRNDTPKWLHQASIFLLENVRRPESKIISAKANNEHGVLPFSTFTFPLLRVPVR